MARIRFRRNSLVVAASIGGLSMLLICVLGGYFIYQSIHKNHLERTEKLNHQLQTMQAEIDKLKEDTVTSWVLKEDIEAGQAIHADMLVPVEIPRDAKPEDLVTKENAKDKYTKIAIKKNTPIVASMLFGKEVTPDDLRDGEYSVIHLPMDLKVNDFIDIRIAFPTGHDFIVQSKKKVDKLLGSTVWYTINEEELLLMRSAIVDAYIANEANIYAVKYSDPYMQRPAIVTYTPNEYVIDLIQKDPNIVKIATNSLEKRVRQQLEKALDGMDSSDKQQVVSTINNSYENVRPNPTSTPTPPMIPGQEPSLPEETPVPTPPIPVPSDVAPSPGSIDENQIFEDLP